VSDPTRNACTLLVGLSRRVASTRSENIVCVIRHCRRSHGRTPVQRQVSVLQLLARQGRRAEHADHTGRGRGRGASGRSAAGTGVEGPGRSSAHDPTVAVSTVLYANFYVCVCKSVCVCVNNRAQELGKDARRPGADIRRAERSKSSGPSAEHGEKGTGVRRGVRSPSESRSHA